MAALRFPPAPWNLAEIAAQLIAANACTEGVLRIAVSRGSGGRGYLPPADACPLLLMETLPLPAPEEEALTLWHASLRRPGPEHLPTACKTANALGSVLARLEAQEQGCSEALMTDAGGRLSECSAANLLWEDRDGALWTPSFACGPVAGIACAVLIETLGVLRAEAPLAVLEKAVAVVACNALHLARPVRALRPQGWEWASEALAARCRAALEAATA